MEFNRRNFMTSLASAPLFVPSTAWGANDRLNYGVIATGGRGRYLNRKFQDMGAQCVALCDVYEPNLELARKDSPGAKSFVDYNDLLAESGIDAVVLAGPDHHHRPMLLAALKAKKDVYAEKPLSWSLEESDVMVKAVGAGSRRVSLGKAGGG